jgi:hypothetical protein
MRPLRRKTGFNIHSTAIRKQVSRMKVRAIDLFFPAEQLNRNASGYYAGEPTPSIPFDQF